MDIILYTDGLYTLVPVTKQMLSDIALYTKVNCFDLCDILRIKLTTYHDAPFNRHVMNDGSGDFFGCICNWFMIKTLNGKIQRQICYSQ